MQIICLLLFVIAIVLCILSGVKAFMLAGCAKVYLLNDRSICQGLVENLKGFLATFVVSDLTEVVGSACDENKLLTCNLITQKMKQSTLLTVIFSFVAFMFSTQMIIDSAILHEQAVYRRLAKKFLDDRDVERARSSNETPAAAGLLSQAT